MKFTLKGKGNRPPNNRCLNPGGLHCCSKFGGPSLNGSRVIVRTSYWHTHTHHTHTQTEREREKQTNRHTDAGNDNTRRPKLASGKNLEHYQVQSFAKLRYVFWFEETFLKPSFRVRWVPGLDLFTKRVDVKILWSLEPARLNVIIIVLLWNLIGISAVLLPKYVSNFKAIGKV